MYIFKKRAAFLEEGIYQEIREYGINRGGVCLNNRQETPEEKRERLRQEEHKKNPSSALGDGLNRAENGNLADLTGGLGWKGTGIIIIVLIVVYVLYNLIF